MTLPDTPKAGCKVALRKEIRVNDELCFDLVEGFGNLHHVRIRLTEVVGRKAILVIMADKEPVPINHIKYQGQQERDRV